MRSLMRGAFAAAAATSHDGFGEQPAKIPRIGFLGPTTAPTSLTSQLEVFRKALADLGYEADQNIIIDGRWPDDNRLEQLPDIAAAFVELKADVIVAVGATAARAAKGATVDIPIVFAGVVTLLLVGWSATSRSQVEI